ncbi:hypothetical protein [Providencia sp. PROV144]|uniref:hypothetical protein n=1 Tax=Providencia sp. PROV144 TaxID=2949854 RepID=UPI00234B7780|nr:hypothetical protein [Providencia sp. PROV144]
MIVFCYLEKGFPQVFWVSGSVQAIGVIVIHTALSLDGLGPNRAATGKNANISGYTKDESQRYK